MKILIIGFQRSGTTLLRRIISAHPEVKKMFHEIFLMKKFAQKRSLYLFVKKHGINPDKDNWGEKTPYYPSMRGISVAKYISQWEDFFEDDARILHIVRHPVDVALSVNKMYGGNKIDIAIRTYKKIVPKIISRFDDSSLVYSFKYEDLLTNSKKILPKIFSFCGLKPKINIERYLSTSNKSKYRKLDPSRAFAHRGKDIPDYNLTGVLDEIDSRMGGTPYSD